MNTAQRVAIGVVGAAALILGLYNAASPPRAGLIGLGWTTIRGGYLLVDSVTPGGPIASAGIKPGDALQLANSPLNFRIMLMQGARTGERYDVTVLHDGAPRAAAIYAKPVSGGLTTDAGRFIDLALTILYVLFGVIVMIKASRSTLSGLLVCMMMTWALATGSSDFRFVAPDDLSMYFIAGVLQTFLNVTVGALIVIALAVLLGPWYKMRLVVIWLAALFSVPLFLTEIQEAVGVIAPLPIVLSLNSFYVGSVSGIACGLVAALITVVLLQAIPAEQRVRARWFASSLIVGWFIALALYKVNSQFLHSTALAVIAYYLVSFSMVGPIYATLRHRLIDLDVVLSRSAVFGTISLVLVSVFVSAEWIGGRIADLLVGRGTVHGIATQLLSFAVAIALGLSIRPLHTLVELRVNGLIFRDRMRKLRLLESFAHEADLIDSRPVLLKVSLAAILQSLETPDVAIYVSDKTAFACIQTSTSSAPTRLDKSERLILQLLHRPELFISEVETLEHWLIVPLTVRAEVVGFIACGAKRDRTTYLPEELRALTTVADHVAMSYALLPEPAQVIT